MKSFKRVSPSLPPRPDGGISLLYDKILRGVSVRYSADYIDYLKSSRSAGCAGSVTQMRNSPPFHGSLAVLIYLSLIDSVTYESYLPCRFLPCFSPFYNVTALPRCLALVFLLNKDYIC